MYVSHDGRVGFFRRSGSETIKGGDTAVFVSHAVPPSKKTELHDVPSPCYPEVRPSRLFSEGKITPYKEGTESYRRICSADLVAQSVQTKDWLRMKLSEPFGGPTVVITHHAPTLRSLQGNPHAGTHMDSAYANRWEGLVGGRADGALGAWAFAHCRRPAAGRAFCALFLAICYSIATLHTSPCWSKVRAVRMG